MTISPALAYADSDGYGNDIVLAGRGVEPNKGVADKDPLTFNTIYTDADGDTPAYVRLWVKDANGVDTFYDMTPDASAPATLSDTDMTNGEAYTYTGVFPKGVYTYAFLTADTHDGQQGDEVSFPAPLSSDPSANPLSFTTGYSSVAFLPGIMASRLYEGGFRRWEPGGAIGGLILKLSLRVADDMRERKNLAFILIPRIRHRHRIFLTNCNVLPTSRIRAR